MQRTLSATSRSSIRSAPIVSRPRPLGRLVPFLLLAIYIAQCAWFVRTQSLTYDEPVDIAGGLDAWRNHRFELWNDHTPLARLLCTLPLLDSKWNIEVQPSATVGWRVLRITPEPESVARRARGMNVILGIVLAWLLWITSRRMFSESAANLCLTLFVFSPATIALFSVATTDGAAALMIFAAAAALAWWRQNTSFARTAVVGVVLGLMLLAKFSTPVMFVIAVVWILVLKPDRAALDPRTWNWTRAGLAVGVAIMVVWAGYFFHISRVTLENGRLTTTFPHRADVVYQPIRSRTHFTVFVPAGEYLEGLRTVVRHNRHGMPAFMLGKVTQAGGWKLYYPLVVALKWPTIPLLLFIGSIVLMTSRKIHAPENLFLFASFPMIYFGFAVFSKFDMGERHILPVYVFVLLFAGAIWESIRERRLSAALVIAAVLLQIGDGMRYAPGYLSYFNVFVRPSNSYRLLADSNLDWGQGLLALRDYERAYPNQPISLAYFGSVEPQVYGIHARALSENERGTGTVVVGGTYLAGQYLEDPAGYRWLLNYPVVKVLDHCLWVFEVPPEIQSTRTRESLRAGGENQLGR